jgi:hypothetical protein
LLRKPCEKKVYVVTHFLPHKKSRKEKIEKENPKYKRIYTNKAWKIV